MKYIVRKYVVEEFEVEAESKEDAIGTDVSDPHSVTVLKVTAELEPI